MADIRKKEERTEIDPDAVRSAVGELPDVETDLGDIKQNLEDVSDPLEAAWIGTARGAYMRAVFCMQGQLKKIEAGIGDLYEVAVQTCDNRVILDQNVSDAANIH